MPLDAFSNDYQRFVNNQWINKLILVIHLNTIAKNQTHNPHTVRAEDRTKQNKQMNQYYLVSIIHHNFPTWHTRLLKMFLVHVTCNYDTQRMRETLKTKKKMWFEISLNWPGTKVSDDCVPTRALATFRL